jgi:hypothetical protein
MPSLSDFGLTPDPRESERRRARREAQYPDESGARRLPRETDSDAVARYRAYEARQRADAEALDEEVELPGVSRHDAGILFGIGVGLGVAALAVVGGLYLGGALGRPVLGAGPEPTPLSSELGQTALGEANDARALELSRVAPFLVHQTATSPLPAQLNSPDIEVIDESAPPPNASPKAASEPQSSAPANGTSSGLANELEELQNSLPLRGPVASPREPSNSTSAPEPSVPPPAEPTAPAETSAPETGNPY